VPETLQWRRRRNKGKQSNREKLKQGKESNYATLHSEGEYKGKQSNREKLKPREAIK
jgi:hypothetical protein